MRVGKYRSGLEEKNISYLQGLNIDPLYEGWKVPYISPASTHFYIPDILLPNNIFVELKGLWETPDRKKHLLIREQHPYLDIRLVFSSSRKAIYKGSITSYGDFCDKHGIQYADKLVPRAWLKEPLKAIPFDNLRPHGRKT